MKRFSKEKEEKILKVLKENGEMTTTKIANCVGTNYYSCLHHLEKLESEGKIVRKNYGGKDTFWRLN